VEHVDPATGSVIVSTGLGKLTCRAGRLVEGDPVEVLIRPESVRAAVGSAQQGLRAQVVSTRFCGSHWEYTLQAGEHRFSSLGFGSSSPAVEPGDDVRLVIDDNAGFAIGTSGLHGAG
jgi:hypothetical protein